MSTDIALPPDFAQKVKAKIADAMLALISDAQLESMVEVEIKKFFDPNATFYIKETTVTVDNKDYRPESNYGYSSQRTKELAALTLGQSMSPFSIFIATELRKIAEAKLSEHLLAKGDLLNEEFNKWFATNAEAATDKNYDGYFIALLNIVSSGMFSKIQSDAHYGAVHHVKQMLKTAQGPTGMPGGSILQINDPFNGEKVL